MQGLPDFPNHWVEETHEHYHRPTYEQMLYTAWEQQHRGQLNDHPREHMLAEQGSDMQAMSSALAGPNGWMMNNGKSNLPHQLQEPIRALMEAKRAEADRVRRIAEQYQHERGPEDPATRDAQEAALQAEAEAHGVVAVERALEHAPQGQAVEQIALTVEAFEDEKRRAEISFNEAQGKWGENHQNTIAARLEMLKAAYAWQGAATAQSAPAQRDYDAAEHPQAIANRANAASEAYRSEAEDFTKKATNAAHKWGKKDPRVVEAQRLAEEATAMANSAAQEADAAQAVADGKPAPKAGAKKVKKKVQRGYC